jgi:hypothetical protein
MNASNLKLDMEKRVAGIVPWQQNGKGNLL